MKVYAVTDVGCVRSLNEDAFYLPEPGEQFCAVADGMGGHNAGEVASDLSIRTFARHMRFCEFVSLNALRGAVFAANMEVYTDALMNRERAGMGTTFVALAVQDGVAYIANVGDSRAYLIREGGIRQLTKDHSVVQEMLDEGLITPEMAKTHPRRNLITRALGTHPTVEIDTFSLEIRAGDVFFLCTDGLCGSVSDEAILECAQAGGAWEEKLRGLITKAIEQGSRDNITAMFALIGEDD